MLLLYSHMLRMKLNANPCEADAINLLSCYGVTLGPAYPLKLVKLTVDFDSEGLLYRNWPGYVYITCCGEFEVQCHIIRGFIPNFSKTAQPLQRLTAKDVSFDWNPDCEEAFASLKGGLAFPPVLAYPRFGDDFTLETDASIRGLGAVLSQVQSDGKLHPIAFATQALSSCEENYGVETLAVVWVVTHFHSYFYGNKVTVITDHSAVRAVLETSNPTGKHGRCWTRVYGRGVREVIIKYRAGQENIAADALSRCPQEPAPLCGIAQGETQVAAVCSHPTITDLLQEDSSNLRQGVNGDNYAEEQRKDPTLLETIMYLHSPRRFN